MHYLLFEKVIRNELPQTLFPCESWILFPVPIILYYFKKKGINTTDVLYTVMAKNIGTLGKYDQRRLWKCICIVNPFDLLFKKNPQNLAFHWIRM